MSGVSTILLIGILACAFLVAGCSDPHRESVIPAGRVDPLIGTWISRDAGLFTIYRFWKNGTFDGRSFSADTPPTYVYTSRGSWETSGVNEYRTEGEHIGYGKPTALAIRRVLTLEYDPASDTLSIAEYQDQVFSRLSCDPDAPVENNS